MYLVIVLMAMQANKNHNLTVTGDAEDIEDIEPVIQDILTIIETVEEAGPATKMPIIDRCRSELSPVMRENSDKRIHNPHEILDLLATYGVIRKEGEKFYID